MSNQTTALIPAARIEQRILLLRGEKVMLDSDLAELYGVETKALNQAVQRNGREPLKTKDSLRSQIVTSNVGRGGRRYRPYVFTEQGVAMLSSVLASPRAVQVNIVIMRTFVQLRQMLSSHTDLSRKLAALEGKYDRQFRVVFDAIRALMSEKKSPRREIGFHTLMPKPGKPAGTKAKRNLA